ncbi:hypothetical protein HJG60_007939 [Phyllostomus discolor]|uniref:Uncharacterized protein n=1 Tax=Phyllostomus discolor TaxID=89673 RepID=A0A834BDF6_9CHIR|nr:hypothetical protein HJG60_007939 [Phyllostomus discolor]
MLWFCLPVTFLMHLGVIFLFPLLSQNYTSPFSDHWALLINRVLREFLLLDRPNLLLSLSCCDSRERVFLFTVVCARCCFLCHTVPGGCRPSLQPLRRLCECCPKKNIPPQLFPEVCSCTYPAFQPQ